MRRASNKPDRRRRGTGVQLGKVFPGEQRAVGARVIRITHTIGLRVRTGPTSGEPRGS